MCGRPKCIEARRQASALKADRGGDPAPTVNNTQGQQAPTPPENQPQAGAGGVSVSTNDKKGIIQ